MAEDIISNIPLVGGGFGSLNWASILIWIAVVLLMIICVGGVILMIYYGKKSKRIYEINLVSHQLKKTSAKITVNKNTKVEKLWFGKYKKFLSKTQQDDVYFMGKRECLLLAKDRNGLHHPLRAMEYNEVKDFFLKCKNIDITKEFIPNPDNPQTDIENPYYKYHEIYMLPSPHEDLEWLGKECEEANVEYKANMQWWQHPNVMIIGTAFICFMMVVMTLLFRNRV